MPNSQNVSNNKGSSHTSGRAAVKAKRLAEPKTATARRKLPTKQDGCATSPKRHKKSPRYGHVLPVGRFLAYEGRPQAKETYIFLNMKAIHSKLIFGLGVLYVNIYYACCVSTISFQQNISPSVIENDGVSTWSFIGLLTGPTGEVGSLYQTVISIKTSATTLCSVNLAQCNNAVPAASTLNECVCTGESVNAGTKVYTFYVKKTAVLARSDEKLTLYLEVADPLSASSAVQLSTGNYPTVHDIKNNLTKPVVEPEENGFGIGALMAILGGVLVLAGVVAAGVMMVGTRRRSSEENAAKKKSLEKAVEISAKGAIIEPVQTATAPEEDIVYVEEEAEAAGYSNDGPMDKRETRRKKGGGREREEENEREREKNKERDREAVTKGPTVSSVNIDSEHIHTKDKKERRKENKRDREGGREREKEGDRYMEKKAERHEGREREREKEGDRDMERKKERHEKREREREKEGDRDMERKKERHEK